MLKYLWAVILLLVAACSQKDAAIKKYPEKIIGRWVVTQHTIVQNAAGEGQKDTIKIDESPIFRQYQPAEIEYGREGGYLLVIKNHAGEIEHRRAGLWKFEHDTLVHLEYDSTIFEKFHTVLTDTSMVVENMQDHDEDGQADDAYRGVYKKVIR
ncbi:MAG TPA: hypothetical protein VEC12_02140 [Bacteroidia bacterium]|nr:hypothetical protein [Bacteroidia bacterium]